MPIEIPSDGIIAEKLTELGSQIETLAEQVAGLYVNCDSDQAERSVFFRVSSANAPVWRDESAGALKRLERISRPALPDPRLIRRIIRQRQIRARFLPGELFADPAWDMLLDLTASRAEHSRVSVTSLCIASGVPPTTALRWIAQMVEMGLLSRIEDEIDRRRAFIALTDKTADAMARYFREIRNEPLLV